MVKEKLLARSPRGGLFLFAWFISISHLYTLRPSGTDWPDHFPTGTYRGEERLLDALREYSEKRAIPSNLVVHIYETDATPLGIGRKYVGCINAGSVLMAGEVPIDRVER